MYDSFTNMTHKFEYGVILNGSQTVCDKEKSCALFEYGVILNGSQTVKRRLSIHPEV